MNLTDLQIELRNIEEHISQLQAEVEKMKPQTEKEKKEDFETITRLARKHPISSLSISNAPQILQKEFVDKWALQCGFCTPGMIMSAVSLLHENPHPTEQEIRDGIAGNLCRCTGYVKIVEAIDAAAKIMAKEVAK